MRTLLILTILATALPAAAAERYYAVVFGAQDCGLNWPRNAHSFATFVRVEECEGIAVADSWQAFTISWLPCSMEVNILRRPEPGTNLDLETTLGLYSDCGKLYQWGPYEVCPELYCRAAEQISRLESGKIKYRALDMMYAERVDNCIHAVGGAGSSRRLYSGTSRGADASRQLVLQMRKWIVAKCAPEEISLRLELDEFPLHRQPFPSPMPLRTSFRNLMLVTPRDLPQPLHP